MTNQYTADQLAAAERRRAIVEYFRAHGGTRTAEHFGIHRTRVYQIVNHMLRGVGYYSDLQAYKRKNYVAKRNK